MTENSSPWQRLRKLQPGDDNLPSSGDSERVSHNSAGRCQREPVCTLSGAGAPGRGDRGAAGALGPPRLWVEGGRLTLTFVLASEERQLTLRPEQNGPGGTRGPSIRQYQALPGQGLPHTQHLCLQQPGKGTLVSPLPLLRNGHRKWKRSGCPGNKGCALWQP